MKIQISATIANTMLILALAGCGPAANLRPPQTTPIATATAAPATTSAAITEPTAVAVGMKLPSPTDLEPQQIVQAYYDAYLAYSNEPTHRNPLADGAYKDADYVTDRFMDAVETSRAQSKMGGVDPILCAQDIPSSVTAGQATAQGDRAMVPLRTSFEGHGLSVELVRDGAGWKIDAIRCGKEAEAATTRETPMTEPTTQAPPSPSSELAGWKVYSSWEFGFQISYPPDWTYEETMAQPDQPPIGPENLKMVALFMPQAWADQLDRQGEADPNAPVLAPFTLEVFAGSLEQYRANYAQPARTESLPLQHAACTLEVEQVTDDVVIYRYRFDSPSNPDLRVAITDYTGGFTDRARDHEQVLALFRAMLDTFQYTR